MVPLMFSLSQMCMSVRRPSGQKVVGVSKGFSHWSKELPLMICVVQSLVPYNTSFPSNSKIFKVSVRFPDDNVTSDRYI